MSLRLAALALLIGLAACASGSDDAKRFSGVYGGISGGIAKTSP